MIDLSTRRTQKLYSIKMPNGEVMRIKLPSQKLLMRIMDLQNYANDSAVAIDLIYEICREIFNLNTAGKVFSADEISEMLDFSTATIVIKDYLQETVKCLGE